MEMPRSFEFLKLKTENTEFFSSFFTVISFGGCLTLTITIVWTCPFLSISHFYFWRSFLWPKTFEKKVVLQRMFYCRSAWGVYMVPNVTLWNQHNRKQDHTTQTHITENRKQKLNLTSHCLNETLQVLKPACTQLTRYGVLYSNGNVVSGDFASVRCGCDQSLAYERNILVHTHKFRFLKGHQVMGKKCYTIISISK